MKIIFNADDYGYSKGVNLGIMEACQNGVVLSTTMMANMPGFEHGVWLYKNTETTLKIGVHLNLTTGKSLGGIYKTITDDRGHFLPQSELFLKAKENKIDLIEVEKEYRLQIQKIYDSGIIPTHMDGHHHNQNLPGIVDIFLKMAKEFSIKALRIDNPSLLSGDYSGIKTTKFDSSFFGDNLSYQNLKSALLSHKETTEIMCHPAYLDNFVYKSSSYNKDRAYELEILTSDEIINFIKQSNIVLSNFCDI